jgi:hypothetical protein
MARGAVTMGHNMFGPKRGYAFSNDVRVVM